MGIGGTDGTNGIYRVFRVVRLLYILPVHTCHYTLIQIERVLMWMVGSLLDEAVSSTTKTDGPLWWGYGLYSSHFYVSLKLL